MAETKQQEVADTAEGKYLELELFSWSLEDPTDYGHTSYINVDGHNVRSSHSLNIKDATHHWVPGRGHGVAIFDQYTGKLVNSVTCDTVASDDDVLSQFLSNLNKNLIIVIVTHDSAHSCDKTDAVLSKQYGCTLKPGYRESFIFVGSTNGPQVWTYSEKRAHKKGPLKRKVSIPLLKK